MALSYVFQASEQIYYENSQGKSIFLITIMNFLTFLCFLLKKCLSNFMFEKTQDIASNP